MLTGYLDFFRETAIDKVTGLDETGLRTSRLPSGWSPLALLAHLRHVERRWLVWGFLGEPVADPWAEERDGRWFVAADTPPAQVVADLREQGVRTTQILARHRLDEVGRPGPRWEGGAPPTLERVALHLLQEYARHIGQLDVVRELIDGDTGE